MSLYYDRCYELALKMAEEHEDMEFAYASYITGYKLGELAREERAKFDPEHPEYYRGSQRAWDELVWMIAKDAWADAKEAPECRSA